MKHVAMKREHDRLVVEAVARRFGPISQVGIHHLTRLEPSQISRIVRELVREGKLKLAGRANNPIGRKQVLLSLNEEFGFVLGVGFDDEKVTAAVMDLHPRIRASVEQPTKRDEGMEAVLAQLVACARSALLQAGISRSALLGIGVAGSGVVDSRAGTLVVSSTVKFLRGAPLRQVFEREFGAPTLVENLTRAKAVAERTLGAGQLAENVIYIEYGRTGIGAGIITGGKLLYGSSYAAGEFGHTHMMEDGPACNCGSFGCLEAIAGASALETRIRKAIAEGSNSAALALAGGDIEKISGWTVLAAAKRGDKTCAAILELAGNYLGLGLANLVNLFNPAILVLDERLSLAGDGLLDQIIKVIKRQALSRSTEHLTVRFGKLGAAGSALGVGSLVLERHFEIPLLKPPRFMIESPPKPIPAVTATPQEAQAIAAKPSNSTA